MVVDCLDELVTRIVNTSLASGHFPAKWKKALVDPRLKSGKDIAFNSQSAYRAGHSTETALLKVKNDILLSMDKQQVTLLVLLDLSAAFDTVDHRVMLKRLESNFGNTGKALQWFASYLTDRSQRTVFDGCSSKVFYLPFGVPQGSSLGPLLFTMYASKLFNIIETHLPSVHALADDTQLYLSFKANSTTSQTEALEALQDCISSIRAWMLVDKLKLNDDKTEIIIIGTRAQLQKIDIKNVKVGDTSVDVASSAIRNLGA